MRCTTSLRSNWSQGAMHAKVWRNSFPDREASERLLVENVPGIFQELQEVQADRSRDIWWVICRGWGHWEITRSHITEGLVAHSEDFGFYLVKSLIIYLEGKAKFKHFEIIRKRCRVFSRVMTVLHQRGKISSLY